MDQDMAREDTRMTVMDAIHARRSVRSYTHERVDESVIDGLLDAAVRAPTAMHEEPWLFVIVRDTALMKRLSDRAKALLLEDAHRAQRDRGGHAHDVFASPDFNLFYNAGTLILICARPVGPFVTADCWLAAQNLMLAACAMGLGTCVIGSSVMALNSPEAKEELGIAAEVSVVAPVIIGVPAQAASPTTRKAPQVLTRV